MENLNKRSIIDMARGAIKERADYEMTRVVENILDPNTSATAARKITITLTLKSDDIRRCCKGYDPAGLSKSEANQILNRLFNEPKRKR